MDRPQGHRLSNVLAQGCLVLAVLLPAFTTYGLTTMPVQALVAKLTGSVAVESGVVSGWQIALATALGSLPVCLVAYSLIRARLSLLGLARGETFGTQTIRHLRGFASGLMAAALSGLVVPPLMGVLLTIGATAGRHALVISASSSDLLMLVFAGILWQAANVMAQAAELAEEHAQIV